MVLQKENAGLATGELQRPSLRFAPQNGKQIGRQGGSLLAFMSANRVTRKGSELRRLCKFFCWVRYDRNGRTTLLLSSVFGILDLAEIFLHTGQK
jgi:hypothetical protein